MKVTGVGVGLRHPHFEYILEQQPKVSWFEALAENYIGNKGRPKEILREISKMYPIVLHGVSMNIGSIDPVNFDYLDELKKLREECQGF